MKYSELPEWAKKEVRTQITNVFPELKESHSSLKAYLDDKDDFSIVNINDDDEEPCYQVNW